MEEYKENLNLLLKRKDLEAVTELLRQGDDEGWVASMSYEVDAAVEGSMDTLPYPSFHSSSNSSGTMLPDWSMSSIQKPSDGSSSDS